MRVIVWCAATAFLIFAGNAMAFTATLKGAPSGGLLGLNEGTSSTITVPLAGGTFEISVALDSSSAPGLRGAQMQFTSNGSGAATIGASSGGVARTNAGTRFNGPQPDGPWDADGSCSTPASAALNATASGFYACGYDSNNTNNLQDLHSLMGWVKITVGSTGVPRQFTISSTIVKGTDQDFNDVPGIGSTITVVQPEPASILLLVGALPFLRRRRVA